MGESGTKGLGAKGGSLSFVCHFLAEAKEYSGKSSWARLSPRGSKGRRLHTSLGLVSGPGGSDGRIYLLGGWWLVGGVQAPCLVPARPGVLSPALWSFSLHVEYNAKTKRPFSFLFVS